MDTLNKFLPPRAAGGASGTQAVARAALLRAIAGSPRREIGLAELERALELERPTAHRILRRLVDEGLVRQNPPPAPTCWARWPTNSGWWPNRRWRCTA